VDREHRFGGDKEYNANNVNNNAQKQQNHL